MGDTDEAPVTLETALIRLAASLLGWVAMFGTATVVVRLATNPDAARTATMGAAKLGERFAMRQATAWANIAAGFHETYDRARANVTI